MIRINGEPVEPAAGDIAETEQNVYSVLTDDASCEVRVEGNEISVNGVRLTFEIDDPRQWKRSDRGGGSQGRASLTAAMPGKIVRVLVAPGDAVHAGQGILVIEAMKMQNELKSPRAGRVTTIEVKANESVMAGQLLATVGQEP